jgi:hypothetical protein
MAEEKKDSKSKIIIIVLVIVIVLMAAGGVTAFILLNNNNGNQTKDDNPAVTTEAESKSENSNPLLLNYDSGAVALDENGLEKQIEEMRKNSEGNVSLEYKNEAESTNGKDFNCYLANSELNTEDMFFAVFTDASMTEQMYLSGLIKPGTSIQKFTSDIPLEKGEYSAVCVFTTVSDDHETMTSQIAVELKLTVK